MESEVRRQILSGDATKIPKDIPKIVRIFISSTFGDTVSERNYLLEKAHPNLVDWCKRYHGLDFQVVDMRWGVRDEASSDHTTSDICLREIRNCQSLSLGPFFMCFLGQRYGYRPLRAHIEQQEFETLLKISDEHDEKDGKKLFEDWYEKDKNSVPPIYVLQPISAKLKYYYDTNPKNEDFRKKDREDWLIVMDKLTRQFRRLALFGESNSLLDQESKHRYFMSVTEDEIREALKFPNKSCSCICFIRTIEAIEDKVSHEDVGGYVDVINNNELDGEAAELLSRLKTNYLPSQLSKDRIHRYNVSWSGEGIKLKDAGHARYLEKLCNTYVDEVKFLVEKGIEDYQKNKMAMAEDALFNEVVHHLSFVEKKCKNFCGRQDLIESVFKILCSPTNHKPVVIHGQSGSGKTSVMAMLARKAHFEKNSNVVVRFLGTSSHSSSVLQVLRSVCEQISEIYNIPLPMYTMWDYNDVVAYLPKLLNMASERNEKLGKTLFIALDSLDQMENTHDAYSCNWIPKNCPPSVHIVLSTLPNVGGILERMLRIMPDSGNYLQVPSLTEENGIEIFEKWLISEKRTTTEEQKDIVIKAFTHCRQPLFLKLAFEEAKNWKSYTPIDDSILASTVRSAIYKLFERLERRHGKVLVSHALGYLVAARNGLTHTELEDILSIDDEVLDDVYQYWSPSNPKVIRLPPLLWSRLKFELEEYMTERNSDGTSVIGLYHRQFIEAATERYLTSNFESMHGTLAEYFMGKWSNGATKKIYLNYRKKEYDAERNVSSQPLIFPNGEYNFRKLRELPYHLCYWGNKEAMIEHYLGNFGMLNACAVGMSCQEVINDLNQILERTDKEQFCLEIKLLRDALRLSKPTMEFKGSKINEHSKYLGNEFLGRLLQFTEKSTVFLERLTSEAKSWSQAHNENILVPEIGCFPSPGGTLKSTIIGHTKNVLYMTANSNGTLLVSAAMDNTVRVWKIETDESVHTLTAHTGHVCCLAVSPDDSRIVSGSLDNTLIIWSMLTGDMLHQITEDHSHYEGYDNANRTLLAITNDSTRVISTASSNNVKVYDIKSGKIISSKIFDEFSTSSINTLAISKDDKLIALGFVDGKLSIYESSSSSLISKLTCHTNGISCLTFTTSNKLVSGSKDSTMCLFKIKEENSLEYELERSLNCDSPIASLCVSSDEKRLVCGCINDILIFSNSETEPIHKLSVHMGTIYHLAMTEDNQYLVSGGSDEIMLVWDLETGARLSSMVGQQAPVDQMVLAKDTVISASKSLPFIKQWTLFAELKDQKRQTYSENSKVVTFTADYKYVAYVSDKQTEVNIWEPSSGLDVHTLCGHRGDVSCLLFSPDNSLVYSGGQEDRKVNVWEVASGKLVKEMSNFPASIRRLCTFNSAAKAGAGMAVCCDDGSAWLVTTASEERGHIQMKGNNPRHAVLMNNREKETLLVCSIKGANYVHVHKFAGRKGYRHLSGHKSEVNCLALNGDESLLASASNDHIIVWKTKGWKKLRYIKETSPGIQGAVNCLTFDPSQTFLVTGHQGKVIKLWSIANGQCITTQYVYSAVLQIGISQDIIVAATKVGQLMVLKCHLPNMVEENSQTTDQKSKLCLCL